MVDEDGALIVADVVGATPQLIEGEGASIGNEHSGITSGL